MQFYDNKPQQVARSNRTMHLQDYSYVSCSMVAYQDDDSGGGGGSSEGSSNGGGGDDQVSMRSGSMDDDNFSWSEEYALSSYAGTSVSSDSGDGGSAHYDDGGSSSSGSGSAGGVGGRGRTKNKAATRDGGGTSKKSKWMKSLWTLVDRMDDDRDRKGREAKRPPQPVKTILRPPTTYKYVVGMSGLPSKVPVYPKYM